MTQALLLQSVSKTYGEGRLAVRALKSVTLSVSAGETVLVMGRSGSGKTTLLTVAGSLMRPTSGSVFVDGVDLDRLTKRQLADLRLRQIGFVFQSFNLLSALTAEQNVAVPLLAAGVKRREARLQARRTLEKVSLLERAHHRPQDLSGGEKQRVAIARGLTMDPPLLLVDEPTANLDADTGKAVSVLLSDLTRTQGSAALIVSHDTRLSETVDRVAQMEDGRLIHSVA